MSTATTYRGTFEFTVDEQGRYVGRPRFEVVGPDGQPVKSSRRVCRPERVGKLEFYFNGDLDGEMLILADDKEAYTDALEGHCSGEGELDFEFELLPIMRMNGTYSIEIPVALPEVKEAPKPAPVEVEVEDMVLAESELEGSAT